MSGKATKTTFRGHDLVASWPLVDGCVASCSPLAGFIETASGLVVTATSASPAAALIAKASGARREAMATFRGRVVVAN